MIKENWLRIQENIAAAKQKSGLKQEISIVAATKYVGEQEIAALKGLGIVYAGENKVQDFLPKFEALKESDNRPEWMFIGRLQSNKVAAVIDKVSLIQSLDRLSLAEEIEKQAKKRNTVMPVLIELNSGESVKAGLPKSELFDFAAQIKEYPHIKVLGLMTMLPNEKPDKNKSLYIDAKECFDKLNAQFQGELKYLSMGMSNDYTQAIECGANMVRLGRCLFDK